MSEVDVRQLTVAQLDQLKTNFENELNSLVSNFQQLKEAQSRFSDSASAIQALPENGEGREMMVPLTSSLYVPGRLTGSNEVLVDIGTGYFVGKSAKEGAELMLKKAAHVRQNTEELSKAINAKKANLDTIVDTLAERAAEQRGGGGAKK